MMLSQEVGQKRKRFSSSDITLSRNNGTGDAESNELTAVVRKWGSAFTVFEGVDRDTPLWQFQICHNGRNSFGYQVLAVAREALQKHPNSGVRDLQQLESVLQVRVLNGAPPQSGPMDPDGIGLEAWQVVLYSTSIPTALDFIELVLNHKVAKGHLLQLPSLHVANPDGLLDTVPQPWKSSPFPLHGPKAFAALPPRGRRHVLCLVEQFRYDPTTCAAHSLEPACGCSRADVVRILFRSAYCISSGAARVVCMPASLTECSSSASPWSCQHGRRFGVNTHVYAGTSTCTSAQACLPEKTRMARWQPLGRWIADVRRRFAWRCRGSDGNLLVKDRMLRLCG